MRVALKVVPSKLYTAPGISGIVTVKLLLPELNTYVIVNAAGGSRSSFVKSMVSHAGDDCRCVVVSAILAQMIADVTPAPNVFEAVVLQLLPLSNEYCTFAPVGLVKFTVTAAGGVPDLVNVMSGAAGVALPTVTVTLFVIGL